MWTSFFCKQKWWYTWSIHGIPWNIITDFSTAVSWFKDPFTLPSQNWFPVHQESHCLNLSLLFVNADDLCLARNRSEDKKKKNQAFISILNYLKISSVSNGALFLLHISCTYGSGPWKENHFLIVSLRPGSQSIPIRCHVFMLKQLKTIIFNGEITIYSGQLRTSPKAISIIFKA